VRRRLDAELVRRRLARSRQHASQLIAEGGVKVAGQVASKAATQVDQAAPITVQAPDSGVAAYASRGAHKLAGALDELSGRGRPVAVEGLVCLDAGASTGGFTDVLLRRGAALVHAVDVGYGQLAWALACDRRVRVADRVNIRHLAAGDLDPPPALVVADLSFISLRVALPALVAVATAQARFVTLVKPQFEVGRAKLPRGGVVASAEDRADAVVQVALAARELGLEVLDVVRSPLPGPAGNVEFFLDLAAASQGQGLAPAEVEAAAVREAGSTVAAVG
jgi:23S rRNA (cytidine1920-2'-O)/16S rRNA (cytidine1409-2'-O)-methyltransferase